MGSVARIAPTGRAMQPLQEVVSQGSLSRTAAGRRGALQTHCCQMGVASPQGGRSQSPGTGGARSSRRQWAQAPQIAEWCTGGIIFAFPPAAAATSERRCSRCFARSYATHEPRRGHGQRSVVFGLQTMGAECATLFEASCGLQGLPGGVRCRGGALHASI